MKSGMILELADVLNFAVVNTWFRGILEGGSQYIKISLKIYL